MFDGRINGEFVAFPEMKARQTGPSDHHVKASWLTSASMYNLHSLVLVSFIELYYLDHIHATVKPPVLLWSLDQRKAT
jgi:hypothetical protein